MMFIIVIECLHRLEKVRCKMIRVFSDTLFRRKGIREINMLKVFQKQSGTSSSTIKA